MQAIILAGGKGTRLRPLTVYTPKPIVPLANKPFIFYQIEILARAGITDIALSLNYQPNKIEDLLGDGSELGVNIRFVTEPSPMGTGGAYKFAADPEKGAAIVLNGDIFTDLNISDIVSEHKKHKAAATIALKPVDDPSRYGLVETDEDGRVLRFLEKPGKGDISEESTNTINAGIYILEPEILGLIQENANTSFEYDVFPKILDVGLEFCSYGMGETYWRDIGNPQSYLDAHLDLIGGRLSGFGEPDSSAPDVATTGTVDKVSVFGTGCVIKPGATVSNSVLGHGVVVEERAVVESSVVWSHTRLSSGCEIRNAFIGRGSHIGRNVIANTGTVVGDKASIPDYSRI
jgi:mannose-1-phosphate guanylyltransferase